MITTYRETFRYGRETDPTDLTVKEWETEEEAIKYMHRYAGGIKFAGVWAEDEAGKTIYEIVDCGTRTFDYRGGEVKEF